MSRLLLVAACVGTAAFMCLLLTGVTTQVVDDDGATDFTNIRAVDAASVLDTIEVRGGTYVENVDVNKSLTLEGVDMVTVRAADTSDNVASNEMIQSNGVAVHVQHNMSFSPLSLNEQGFMETVNNNAKHQGSYSNVSVYSISGKMADSSWPMSKCDAARTGYNADETMLSPPLVKIWEFQGVSGDVFETISSANGTIYVGMQASVESWADSNKLYAIDAATGLKRWEFILDDGGRGAMDVTPAIANGWVYFGGQLDDKLYAFNAETGQKVWEFTGMGSMYCSHPAVVDGVVYAKGRGMLYALNASTGLKIWEFPTAGSGRNSPAIVDGTLYIGSRDGFLYAIDAKTGTEKWNLSDTSREFSCPLISNGTMYIDTSSTVIKALNAKTGSLKWEVTLEEELPYLCEGVFALANDILYVSIWEGTGGHGKLYALDASTGSEKWSFDTGAKGVSTPAVANGIVYVCGWQNRMVYTLDAITGVGKWQYQCDGTISSSPTIADGVLYVGAWDKLYAFAGPRVHNINTEENFSTIQAAIDDYDTKDGHTVTVNAGTYVEHVVVDKSLKLIGESKNITIIDGNGGEKCIEITADNVEISGFGIQNGIYGIWLESSDACILNDNIISDNYDGIYLNNSNNNTITYNSLSDNILYFSGIHLSSSNNNAISDNDLSGNSGGITLSTSHNNRIYHNNLIGNDNRGIYISSSNSNTIYDNELSNNHDGIYVYNSNNNLIYHNNLIDNTYQAYDNTGTNQWDNDYPSGGNYWSDYIGIDTFSGADQNVLGSDGIGDTYYGISGGEGARDRYPFMSKGGWVEENIPPVASFTYSPLNPVVNQTVVFDLSSSYDPDGEIVYHQLNFGDGGGAEGPGLIETIGYNYSSAGNYSVTLTVTDNDGYTASETKIISVVDGDTTISIADASAPSSHTTTTQIIINNMTNFGAATVTLSYDPTVVRIASVTAGDVGTPTANINNTAGTATIDAHIGTATGPDRPITFANIELLAVGGNGETSPLTLAITTLTDAGENSVPATAASGVFTISGLRGDANDDSAMNAIDAMFVAQYTAGNRNASTLNMDNADANLDGGVNAIDAMFIAQYVAGARTW